MPIPGRRMFLLTVAVWLVGSLSTAGGAEDRVPQFERDIRPILVTNCLGCHGEQKREAGLDLRSVSAMLAGGEAGPVVVRGHPEFSELVAVLESGKMPPEDATPLTEQQIALIKEWIAADTPAVEEIVIRYPPPKVTDEDRQHWAWQKLAKHEPPEVRQGERVRNELDRFVLAMLEKHRLTYSNEATPERLVRRLYLDLLGLPPAPAEVDEFLNDVSPRRVEKLVDRLLASRHSASAGAGTGWTWPVMLAFLAATMTPRLSNSCPGNGGTGIT